ncbi:dCTP deaminase [candidate division KSB1 bacterium]|nr:dCTP deaminase [candidate division KSB1 bacterium]
MSLLLKDEIIDLLDKPAIQKRLVITPILDRDEQIGASSVDVRLGNEFIIFRKVMFPAIDIGNHESIRTEQLKYQERLRINFKEPFVFHPNDLILGCTFEYIALPKSIGAYLKGRSTWARMGLIVSAPTKIDPFFHGCLTLELHNAGDAPLVLYPGVPIAQLVFHRSTTEAEYKGHYNCATGPQYPRVLSLSEKNKFWFSER